MVKPRKNRNVMYPPWMHYFKPHGHMPFDPENSVKFTIDEYEAIRLADHEDLKQEQAAKQMNISRPTFTRLINSARKKIADAMVNGKMIKIEGGNFVFLKNRLSCGSCGKMWETDLRSKASESCPDCNSKDIEDMGRRFGRGRFHGSGPGRKFH